MRVMRFSQRVGGAGFFLSPSHLSCPRHLQLKAIVCNRYSVRAEGINGNYKGKGRKRKLSIKRQWA